MTPAQPNSYSNTPNPNTCEPPVSKLRSDTSQPLVIGQSYLAWKPLTSIQFVHEARHGKIAAHLHEGSGSSSRPACYTALSQLPRALTMTTTSQRPERREGDISPLNAAIEAMNLAKEISSITPAKAVFGSVSVVLTMVRVRSPSSATIHSMFTCS